MVPYVRKKLPDSILRSCNYTFQGISFLQVNAQYPSRRTKLIDPINNQTYLNVPAILYFLEKGAQPTATVHDILKKAGVFTELTLNQTKFT